MSNIERMTVTMPADMAALVKATVETGDYASTSEVVRDALRQWKTRRAIQIQEIAALKHRDRVAITHPRPDKSLLLEPL